MVEGHKRLTSVHKPTGGTVIGPYKYVWLGYRQGDVLPMLI